MFQVYRIMSLCCMKSFSVAIVRARNVNPANYNYYDSVHITGCFFLARIRATSVHLIHPIMNTVDSCRSWTWTDKQIVNLRNHPLTTSLSLLVTNQRTTHHRSKIPALDSGEE